MLLTVLVGTLNGNGHIVLISHPQFVAQLDGTIVVAEVQPDSLLTNFLFLLPDKLIEEIEEIIKTTFVKHIF